MARATGAEAPSRKGYGAGAAALAVVGAGVLPDAPPPLRAVPVAATAASS
ncbi:MAG: hypothetical protein ACLUE1_08415 [Adlercreutzia equolifaciens]